MTRAICIAVLMFVNSVDARESGSGPLSPTEGLELLEVAAGLEVTLFAHEPMVVNPTNMDIDERGRIWVTEGVNYRRWKNLKPAGDRIVILEDTTGDGRADRSKVYYQDTSINSALGICVLGSRVIVSCSPHVFIFHDDDGDDVPDRKQVLFTGVDGVQHDHGIHAFVFGPDGKLYFNFGNSGRQLRRADGEYVVDLQGNEVRANGRPYRQGMIFRCNFDGSAVETLGHNFRNNYEVAVDSFGTLWQSDNDDDGNRGVRINYVMEFGNFGYSDESTGAGWKAPRTNMNKEIPLRHWHLNDPGVVPNFVQTGAGSPTGICVYEGGLLPEAFRDQVLHCDAGPNVVRAYPAQKSGAGYEGSVLDLVKGRDSWFRPADVCSAADGSVFIADWYDAGVGGHNMADNKSEEVRGRIYRVAPPGHKRVVPPLDVTTPRGACEALESPHHARRFLAWRALHEMQGKAEGELLELWKSDHARMRARALHLLARIRGREAHYVQAGISADEPDIRIAALRIARERKLDLMPLLRRLVRDPSAHVRRECAIALRHHAAPEAAELWAALALQHDGKDRWYLEALGIGADRQEDRYFAAWLGQVGEGWNTPSGRDLVWRSRAAAALPLLARLIRDPAAGVEPLETREKLRFFRAFDFHRGPAKEEALVTLLASDDPKVASEALARLRNFDPKNNTEHMTVVKKLLESSRGTPQFVDLVRRFDIEDEEEGVYEVLLAEATTSAGVRAVQWLLDNERDHRFNVVLYGGRDDIAIKLIHALGNAGDERTLRFLVPAVTDEERDIAVLGQAARALVRTKRGAAGLLQQARHGRIIDELKPLAGWLLSNVVWEDIRNAAASVLPPPPASDKKPLPPVSELVKRKGDAAAGAKVYEKICITCHQAKGRGTDFGPQLSEIGDKLGRDALFLSILDPNAGISFDYTGTIVSLTTGDEVVGIVESETDEDLALKTTGGITTTYKKSDVAGRRPLNMSFMPANLQDSLSTQELVDLVEYLTTLRK